MVAPCAFRSCDTMSGLEEQEAEVVDGVDQEQQQPECRICRCTAEEAGEQLFTPCACKGSLEWVHPSCLEQWRQACPTAASRLRCDMCRTNFVLEQQRPGFGEICRPCGEGALRTLLAIVLAEAATVAAGYCVSGMAFLTGVSPEHYTFRPGLDLHLSGWTLLLPEATIAAVVRKMRASHLALVEANPAFERSWWSRYLFERLNAPSCALAVFTLVLAAVVIPMGYLGKSLIWLLNHGWEGLDEVERARGAVAGLSPHGEVAWALDPAHFYIASMVFCISSFLVYLVCMAMLIARQYPDRLGCCKVLVALVAFEIFVMMGGYIVKILGVITGVYGRVDDSATGCIVTGDGSGMDGGVAGDGSGMAQDCAAKGWAAVEWATDWNHHVLSLTAWMPIVHSVVFLQRIRVGFPRFKEAHPGTPCMGCLTRVLETWSARRASAAIALITLFLIHALGLGGKLAIAAIFNISMRSQSGRVEGENSGAVRGDVHDDHSAHADATAETGNDDEFEFGWGADYTHYFIGFVLLYVCAGCCAGCCGLYARYKTLANSGSSTVVGTPPASSPRGRPPEHEANP